jgi:hypothetical protein
MTSSGSQDSVQEVTKLRLEGPILGRVADLVVQATMESTGVVQLNEEKQDVVVADKPCGLRVKEQGFKSSNVPVASARTLPNHAPRGSSEREIPLNEMVCTWSW